MVQSLLVSDNVLYQQGCLLIYKYPGANFVYKRAKQLNMFVSVSTGNRATWCNPRRLSQEQETVLCEYKPISAGVVQHSGKVGVKQDVLSSYGL